MTSLFTRCFSRARELDAGRYSLAIAYYALLSLIPLLLAAGAILPYFHIDPQAVAPYFEGLIPDPLLSSLRPILERALTEENGGLLSIGIAGTVWSASKVVNAIMVGVDKAYCLKATRHFITSRIASVGVMILLMLALAALMVVIGFGETLLALLFEKYGWMETLTLNTLKWPATLLLLFLMLVALYRLTPHIRTKVSDVWAGALFATAGILILVKLFALYLSICARSLTAYGVLSAFFVLLLFLRMIGYILLWGAVINAVRFKGSCTGENMKRSSIDGAVMRIQDRLSCAFSKK